MKNAAISGRACDAKGKVLITGVVESPPRLIRTSNRRSVVVFVLRDLDTGEFHRLRLRGWHARQLARVIRPGEVVEATVKPYVVRHLQATKIEPVTNRYPARLVK